MPITKATASRVDIRHSERRVAVEYLSLIEQLLYSSEFAALASYRHHKMNRQQHSFNVSWYAFRLAKLFRLDAAAVARSGLLHFVMLNIPKMSMFMNTPSRRWKMHAS